MVERDIKEYIVKLNDRNIQRHRETGFTIYAILAIILYCLFYLIENLKIGSSIIDNIDYLSFFIITSNSIFILFYYYSLINFQEFSSTKIFVNTVPFKIDLNKSIYIIPILLISILNFTFIKNSQNVIHKIYLYVFGFYTLLNVLFPIIINSYRNYLERIKLKKGISIENISFTMLNERKRNLLFKVSLTYNILLFILTIIMSFNIKLHITLSHVSDILKFAIMFFGLFYLVNKAYIIKNTQINNDALEDFEKEIYLKNISNFEIKERFENDFDGVPFEKWLSDKHLEINTFFDTKKSFFFAQYARVFEVDRIDKTIYMHEFNGRLSEIVDCQSFVLNETNDYIQSINSNFKNLLNFASLNDEEHQELNYVNASFSNRISEFNNLYKDVSNKILERQNSI